jgi:uncharacterized RDD family membrane protein YckC
VDDRPQATATSRGAGAAAGSQAGSLVTPDAVALAFEPATVGSRGAAYLLDLLLLAVGLLLLTVAEAVVGLGGLLPGWVGVTLVLLLLFGWQFGYPIGFETLWRGRTPGKAALGLRVVTAEGAPVRVRHSAVRATVGLFELTGTLGLGAIVSSFVSSRGQRLGDLAAGTLVVRERRAGPGVRAERFVPPPGLEGYAARLDVSALDREAYAAVRETVRRAPSLPADARRRVTEQLAGHLVGRVSPPPPHGLDAERWLVCVAAAVQRRSGGQPSDPWAPATWQTGGAASVPGGVVPTGSGDGSGSGGTAQPGAGGGSSAGASPSAARPPQGSGERPTTPGPETGGRPATRSEPPSRGGFAPPS